MNKDRIRRFTWEKEDVTLSQCVRCRHKSTGGIGCSAFPAGIPMEILTNDHDHSQPFPGDGGTLYEADPEPEL